MTTNNKLLKTISNNTGGTMTGTNRNNKYLREIARNTGSVLDNGHKSDNFYLKEIAKNTEDDLDEAELLHELQDTVATQSETIIGLEKDVSDLESANSTLQGTIDSNQDTINDLQGQVSSLTTDLDTAKNKIFLHTDKSVIQTTDEVTLSATVLKDGKLKEGITVNFYKEE